MAQKIIGIEVGSYQIKVFRIGDALHTGLHRQKRRRSDDLAEDRKLLVQTLTSMKKAGHFDADWVVVGYGGSKAQAIRLKAPFDDESKIAAILPGLLDSAVPFDTEGLSYSWELQKDADGKPEVFVIFANTTEISEDLMLLEEAGLDPRFLLWAPTSGHYFRTNGLKSHMGDLVATIDIGHNHTRIAVTHKNSLVAARIFPKGGHQVTLALAQHLDCQYAEAEKLKESGLALLPSYENLPPHEAAAQRALHEAYAAICLGVIQTLRSYVDSQPAQLDGVILGGGGSATTGLDKFLNSKLKAPVLTLQALQNNPAIRTQAYTDPILKTLEGQPDGMMAAGLAMAGQNRGKILGNMRIGPNRWKGQFDAVKQRSKSVALWAGILALSLVANCTIKSSALSSELNGLQARQTALCKKITGKNLDSFSRCQAIIKSSGGTDDGIDIPNFSAGDIYTELARVVPNDKDVKMVEADITDNKVRLRGTTSSFENVDAVVSALANGKCFETVEKGRATQRDGNIEFNISIGLNCDGAQS